MVLEKRKLNEILADYTKEQSTVECEGVLLIPYSRGENALIIEDILVQGLHPSDLPSAMKFLTDILAQALDTVNAKVSEVTGG